MPNRCRTARGVRADAAAHAAVERVEEILAEVGGGRLAAMAAHDGRRRGTRRETRSLTAHASSMYSRGPVASAAPHLYAALRVASWGPAPPMAFMAPDIMSAMPPACCCCAPEFFPEV